MKYRVQLEVVVDLDFEAEDWNEANEKAMEMGFKLSQSDRLSEAFSNAKRHDFVDWNTTAIMRMGWDAW